MSRELPVRAFVSLGSNLGDRAAWLAQARQALIDGQGIRVAGMSSVIETEPVDVIDQPPFLNQVLRLDVPDDPQLLLDVCLDVERSLGRERAGQPKGGPRTIDLDVLLFAGRSVDEAGLMIPHPRLHERPFFLRLCLEAGASPAWLPDSTTEPVGLEPSW